MMRTVTAIGIAMLAWSPAEAALLKYSYTMKGGTVVTGALVGSVTQDGNVFSVSGARDFTYNGSRFAGALRARSADAVVYGLADMPSIALNKSRVDLAMIEGSGGASRYLVTFGVGNKLADSYQRDVVLSQLVFGSNDLTEAFDPASLRLSVLRDATLDFSYRLSIPEASLAGTLTGWVSDDGSLFEVNEVRSISVNGRTISDGLQVEGTDRWTFGYMQAPASVRLDGSLVDFTVLSGDDWLGFGVGNNLTLGYGGDVAGASRGLGGWGTWERFQPGNLALRLDGQAVAVPEPASWALMLAGFGLVGATVRRRARVSMA